MPPHSPLTERTASRWLLIAAGGAIGSLARHGVVALPIDRFASLLIVNGVGALAIGILTARLASSSDPARWYAFSGLGLCGGFTTFSTHMVDVASRADRGETLGALAVLATVAAVALIGAFVGHRLAAERSAPST